MANYKLPDNLGVAHLEINVLDLERMLAFYRDLLGFQVRAQEERSAQLAPAAEAAPILTLSASPGLKRQPQSGVGLYHVAFRFPDRSALATALLRVAACEWPLQGASDHRVSEAIYFADPEGNGIEIYRDRPRSDWPRLDGMLQMGNLPLDLNALLEEADREWAEAGAVHPEMDIGHIHLQVSSTATATAFYADLLGMDMMMELPTAVFLSAGGYHHHLGVNTWHIAGAPPREAGMSGLASFAFELPEPADWLVLIERLEEAGQRLYPVERAGRPGLWLGDQDGNRVELLTAADPQVSAKLAELDKAAA